MKLAPWISAAAMMGAFFVLTSPAGEVSVAKIITAPEPEPAPVTVLAFGDLMLDRAVRDALDESGPGYPFAYIEPLIAGHDIVVANAEGAFTDNASLSEPDHSIVRFTFATSTLPTLRSLGFTDFSQANNHALDFGRSGLQESKDAMARAGIASFGDPFNENPGPLYIEVRGQTLAFVGYHQLFNPDASSTLAAISAAHARGAFTIVYPHWGVEYNLGTTTLQTKLAHEFIDAGADLVLGSHPHVVEPTEIYNGKLIVYSMGNFVFDQYWNDRVKRGLAVELSLTQKEAAYRLISYVITDLQPTPTGEERSFVLQR